MGLCSRKQLEAVLREPVSQTFTLDQGPTLTCCFVRFVDRDMFMRYRGSGIGHRYMREIEEMYENLSRERSHHKERQRPLPSSGPSHTEGDSGSDDEDGPRRTTSAQAAQDPDDSDLDSDYEPPGSDVDRSSSASGSEASEVDSDGEAIESFGLGGM